MSSIVNVLNNTVLPLDPRKKDLLVGSVQLITLEVLMAKVIRKVLSMGNRGFLELALIHAVSLPMIGGFSGMFGQNKKYDAATAQTSFQDGAKGVPAVFMAQYITNVAAKGFHLPKVSMKEILVTAASKVLTRPLITFMYPKLHKSLKDGFDVENMMEIKQQIASNLKMQ
jgi:hypothetical protein